MLELFTDGKTIKYIVNGKVANEATGSNPARGKILFQSKGAEVYFRNIELLYAKTDLRFGRWQWTVRAAEQL